MKKIRHILEYLLALFCLQIVKLTPFFVVNYLSIVLGNCIYYFSKKRRTIAIDNISKAYGDKITENQVKDMAKKSCHSLIRTFLEGIKYDELLKNPKAILEIAEKNKEILTLFQKAKVLHDNFGGCIFVTPHLGNWEFLPHVSSAVNIPLTVVARPLDNPYVERLLYSSRVSSGQILIPKRNALFKLQQTLSKKRSIGLLPDQSTMKGINVNFFGRTATATPIPAMLAVNYKKPLIVVACCRDSNGFTGFVSEPIMAKDNKNEKDEVLRLTQEMTDKMEEIIKKFPHQYLWIHNRWKKYE